jgi:hypothetical protein
MPVLPYRIVGGDVTGRVEEALVDLGTRHEAVDVDRVGAPDFDGLQVLVLNEEELAFADLVAAGLVVPVDRFTGRLVDELLAQPVAGRLICRNETRSEDEHAA